MAEVWAARVYCSRNVFDPKPGTIFEKEFQLGAWSAAVTIGEVPAEVVQSIAVHRKADSLFSTDLRSTHAVPISRKDRWLRREATDLTERPITLAHCLYTTFTIRQSVDIRPAADDELAKSSYFWYDWSDAYAAIRNLQESQAEAFERLVGFVLQHLSADAIGELEHRDHVFVGQPGKPWSPVIIPQLGEPREVREGDIDALLRDVARLEKAGEVPTKDSPLVRIARFAMQQAFEADSFRRFMWCYAGLELAAGTFYSTAKAEVKGSVRITSRDGSTIDGLAANQLIWPTPQRESDETNRSIMFRFAVMALMLSPATANEDVEQFRRINEYRNKIHGSISLHEPMPVGEVARLFERYYALISVELRQR